jgi:hypothetical protein
MLVSVKRRIAPSLRNVPWLYVLASKTYHKLNSSFTTLSPEGLDALQLSFERSRDELVGNEGDYYEFGVYRGYMFWWAQQVSRDLGLDQVHFYGFDSFQGLPEIEGVDRTNNQFYEGQFACSKDQVVAYLSERDFDWSRATLIEGYYAQTLTENTKRQYPFRPVSVAYIDCDLYASTREVLAWLRTLLTDGSILLFDDWYAFGDDVQVGQPRAMGEFLAAHRELAAEPFLEFGRHGKGFIMRRRSRA